MSSVVSPYACSQCSGLVEPFKGRIWKPLQITETMILFTDCLLETDFTNCPTVDTVPLIHTVFTDLKSVMLKQQVKPYCAVTHAKEENFNILTNAL